MLRPMPLGPIPPETVRVARAVFPKGNRYFATNQYAGDAVHECAFPALFPTHGQPAQPSWQLE
jgi:transposase